MVYAIQCIKITPVELIKPFTCHEIHRTLKSYWTLRWFEFSRDQKSYRLTGKCESFQKIKDGIIQYYM